MIVKLKRELQFTNAKQDFIRNHTCQLVFIEFCTHTIEDSQTLISYSLLKCNPKLLWQLESLAAMETWKVQF